MKKHDFDNNLRRLNLISKPIQSDFKLVRATPCIVYSWLVLLSVTCLHKEIECVRLSYHLWRYNLPSFKFRYGNGYQEQLLSERASHTQYFSNLTHGFHFLEIVEGYPFGCWRIVLIRNTEQNLSYLNYVIFLDNLLD